MRLAIALALVLAGCVAPPAPRTAGDGPTVVSLNPCADAILAEIAPRQLLAVSHYSHDPRASSMPAAQAHRFAATGGTVEEIAALAPDLVVGDAFTPPATRSALQRLGVRHFELPFAGDLAASGAQIRALAAAVRRPAAGEALVARIDAALAGAAPPRGWRAPATLVWQGGGLIAGDGSLIAVLAERAGFRPVAATRGLGQGAVLPLEAMLADPPETILTAGDPRAESDRLLSHPALGTVPARRARIDPTLIYCAGPTIPRALARLVEIREGGG